MIEDHLGPLEHQMAQGLAQHHEAVQRLAEVPRVDSAQQIIAEVGATPPPPRASSTTAADMIPSVAS